jgi:hypothetical protein
MLRRKRSFSLKPIPIQPTIMPTTPLKFTRTMAAT